MSKIRLWFVINTVIMLRIEAYNLQVLCLYRLTQ